MNPDSTAAAFTTGDDCSSKGNAGNSRSGGRKFSYEGRLDCFMVLCCTYCARFLEICSCSSNLGRRLRLFAILLWLLL